MKVLEVVQGQPEWHAARAQYFCASEAAAMMGESKYQTRNDLLKLKATGIGEEIDASKQFLFDRGHAAEAAIRPYVESLIGEDLYPATGVEGELLASFDGLTMAEDLAFEHKLWSDDLAGRVREQKLDPHYIWQMEHQMAVSGARRTIFVVSDGTPEKCVHMFYESQPALRRKLLAGWAQFKRDLAAYVPAAAAVEVMAAPVESLPAVSVRMDGKIAVISNLDVFGAKLKAFVEKIDKNPSTDQAFADAEAACKTLQKAQDALEQAESAALAQTSSIEEMRRTVNDYATLARTTRLMLEKVVKNRKEQIRIEIHQRAQAAFAEHIAKLNKRLSKVQMPPIATDFAGAMKGKKTISGVQSAVDDELARAKIAASETADHIGASLAQLEAAGHAFLFNDLSSLVMKQPDDLANLIKGRIADHAAEEEKRREREREKIREEERQRAENEERARLRKEEQDRIAAETPPPVEQPKPAPIAAACAAAPTTAAPAGRAVPHKATRPTDAEIISVLSIHYRVHETKVIEWLLAIDLDAASKDCMKEFA